MRERPECRHAIEDGAPACPSCAPAPARRPSRKLFWVFVAAMILAVAGGGAIAALGRRKVAERKGHPDTIAPAEAVRAKGEGGRSTPTSTPTPTPDEPAPPAGRAKAE